MSEPGCPGGSCGSSREKIALLLIAVTIVAVAAAFFWPWMVRSHPAGGLTRYAPLEDGTARLSVLHDAEEKPTAWVSSNDRFIPPGLAVGAELRKTQREAIGVLFRKPGEPAIDESALVSRLADSQLYQTRSRTLDAAGKVSESLYLSIRIKSGDYLVSVSGADPDHDIIFEPPLPALPGKIAAGHAWKGEGVRRMGGQSARYSYAGKVVGKEALENAAGRFEDCVKLETKISISQDGKVLHEGTTLYWLASGTGVVEWRELDSTGRALQRSVIGGAGNFPPLPAPSPAAATNAAHAGITPQATWKLTRFASVRAGIDTAANTVPATWIPTEPPLVLAVRYGGDLTAFDPGGKAVWRFHPSGVIYGPPAWDAKRKRIYFGATDKGLHALDARGLFLWSFLTGDNVACRPVIAGDVIVFGSEDRNLYGLDANTGRLKWTKTTGGSVVSSPTLVGGNVIIGSDDGAIYAIDPATGRERWTYEGDVPIECPIVAGADGRVFAVTQQGDLLALDAADGRLLWSEKAGTAMEAAPAPGGKLVFVVADRRLSAFEQANGKRIWRTEKSIYTGTPVVLNETVIVAGHAGSVHCLGFDGREQHAWTAEDSGNQGEPATGLRFGPTVGGDALWLADQGSIVRRLGDEKTGPTLLKPAWVRRFSDAPFEKNFLGLTPAQYGGQAVVVDSARSIFLLDPQNGESRRIGSFGESGSATIDPVTAGNVLLAVAGTTLHAIHLPDGVPLWKRTGDGATLRPVSVIGDTVLWLTQRDAGSEEPVGAGTLFALDLATGSVRWQKPLHGFPGPGGAIAHGGTVFTSTPPRAFDLATGAERWRFEMKGLAVGGPVLSEEGDRLFVGIADAASGAGSIAALSSADGSVIWQAPLGDSMLNPMERAWIEQDVLVVPLWNGGIMALDSATGAERWRHQPGTSRLGAITVANGRVWLMQQNLEVVGLDAHHGHVVARFALDIDLSSISSFAPRVLVMGNRLLAPFAMMLLGLDLTK